MTDISETGSWKGSPYDPSPSRAVNPLLFAVNAMLNGFRLLNVIKGFVWSIALTNMHFMGVKALQIPKGFVALSPARVILCASISWSVCYVGVILMADIEVNIFQQLLFSVIAATGVAAVHFSGLSLALNWPTQANYYHRNVCLLFLVYGSTVARNRLPLCITSCHFQCRHSHLHGLHRYAGTLCNCCSQ